MQKHSLWLTLVAVMALLMVACAPKPILPSPAIPKTTTLAAPQVPAATPKAEDGTWAKVVKAAKKEGNVVVYSATWTGDAGLAMADAFFKTSGIRAEIIAGPGASIAERVKTEHRMKAYTADVGEFSVAYASEALREGLLFSVARELPTLQEDVWVIDPKIDEEGTILGAAYNVLSPWVNINLVKPSDEPASWTDLLAPRWKGKILMFDARTTSQADRGVYTLTKQKWVPTDYFQRLVTQGLIVPSGIGFYPPYEALARGDGAILAWGVDGTGAMFQDKGAPIKPTIPKEGVFAAFAPIQMMKGAPSPNAGKVFLDFVFSAQGQEIIGKFRKNSPLRKDVPNYSIFRGVALPKIAKPSIEDDKKINDDFSKGVAAKLFGLR